MPPEASSRFQGDNVLSKIRKGQRALKGNKRKFMANINMTKMVGRI